MKKTSSFGGDGKKHPNKKDRPRFSKEDGGGRVKKSNSHQFKRKPKKNETELREIEKLQTDYDKIDPSSIATFADLPLSSSTRKGLADSGFVNPTDIQRESLPLSLHGRDILGAAKTGSGKTLAFLIPLLERLYTHKWSRLDGLGALVITPTRELAYQIFEQLRKVGKHHDFSAGLVIGGKDLHFESKRMAACNIVICTPGRLLQHMDENPQFDATNLKLLILDEADRCLELGFSEQMNAILENLPSGDDGERQTLLFSATQTRSIKDLARLSLKDPVFVSVHEHADKATPDELTENYMVCELEQKVDMMWSFIKSHKKKKVLVFVQSCKQAKYLCDLFKRLRAPTQMAALYGTLNQLRRMAIYKDFCEKESGVLVATDLASRGLDFPTVDWVFQLDCPEDWKAYNHRVGRTARNKAAGQALLILLPTEEAAMIKQLKIHKFPIEKIEVNPAKVVSIQRKIEAQLASDVELKEEAQRAFQSYLKSIFLLKDKTVFDVSAVNTDAYAASLGLSVAPRVRFLQRRMKAAKAHQEDLAKKSSADVPAVAEVPPQRKGPERKTILQISDSEGEDGEEGDDMLTVKRVNHNLSDDDDDEALGEIEPRGSQKNAKVVTKAAAAKRLLKKNILANRKVQFDNDGEVVEDSSLHKISKEGKLYEAEKDDLASGGGIDISRAKEILKAEDAFDKKKEKGRVKEKHKEQKRKEKEARDRRKKQQQEQMDEGSDSSDSGPDVSWLPDPDKIYGEESKSDEKGADSSSKRKWKPPSKEKVVQSAKRRKSAPVMDDDEDLAALPDDELLALKLLGR